ncbi:unnamed protein product [Rhizophagus irregularis]|nr:unnamed protein product [Rhizophagus irregularis]
MFIAIFKCLTSYRTILKTAIMIISFSGKLYARKVKYQIPFSLYYYCKFGRIRNDVKKSAIVTGKGTIQFGAALAKRLPAPYKLYYPDCLVRNSA